MEYATETVHALVNHQILSTPSEASHIFSDILVLFTVLLGISFFTLHEKDILKASYLSLSDHISQ